MNHINELIWQESYWLPNGISWEQIQIYNRSDKYFYYLVLSAALVIYFIRFLFEMFRMVQTLFMTDSKEKNIPGRRLQ